jgi:conserved oligomeric Golgi complex subunit 3
MNVSNLNSTLILAEDSYFDVAQLEFGSLVQPALQDAQSRLVFRTENLIINEIQNFAPKDKDLDYPNLLHVSASTSAATAKSPEQDIMSPNLGSGEYFDSEVLFQGWYPTLRKSIWILSKIYRLVNVLSVLIILTQSAVFDDLAHQVVHLCIQSLFTASNLLVTKKSRLEADLFLIKHLLILKEQIGAFDIEYVRPETEIDIPGLVERFREFLIFSSAALTKVVQLPVVVENMLDAKEELDGKLRIAINGFTKASAEDISLCVAGKGAIEVSDQEIKEASEKFRENAEKLLPTIQQKTEEYIVDPRTTDILVNAIMVVSRVKANDRKMR